MADIYVDSNATGGADGSTWADAYTTLAAAAAVDVAGDTIWVASDHSESTATAISWSWAGTIGSPTRIISADKTSGEPPSTVQLGATVATTGASNIIANAGDFAYFFGITFNVGSGASTASWNHTGIDYSVYEQCTIELTNTSSVSDLILSAAGPSKYINCSFRINNASQSIRPSSSTASWCLIDGGTWLSGGTSPTNAFDSGSRGETATFSGFDLSALSSTVDLFNNSNVNVTNVVRNSKLPSGWTGSLNTSSSVQPGSRFALHNCDGGDVNYALYVTAYCGDVVHETTLVKSGGASDGTTPISWDMTTNANAEWSHQTLDSPEIVRWFPDTTAGEALGVSTTIEVDILHDSVTNLQNDEIWLEGQILTTSGFPLSTFNDDAAATYTTTPADQAASTATWVTTGLTNPNKQKLSITVTPQEAGFLILKVKLAKPSYTVYVDPNPTVTQ